MDVVIATNSINKFAEIKRILKYYGINALSLSDCKINIEIEETGNTFYDNALIKAKTIYEIVKVPVIADDSGLMVDSLDGAPGVYSARFFSEKATDKQNNDFLLQKLKNETNRNATFISIIVFYLDEQNIICSEGICKGQIGYMEIGDNGFGYDPLFIVNGKTYAQMTKSEKDLISHRSNSLRNLREKLKDIDLSKYEK